jgi:hypothetical protein
MRGGAVCVAMVIAVAVAGAGCGDAGPHSSRFQRLAVARIYMGVACERSNSIRCDRVGLAVWLPERARTLEASLAGARVRMRWRATTAGADFDVTRYRRVHYYEGFLAPAGLIDGALRVQPDGGRYHWTGAHARSARMTLVAREATGRAARVTLRVGLAAGWG